MRHSFQVLFWGLLMIGGCTVDMTGYSYRRGEIPESAWQDSGTVIALSVKGEQDSALVSSDRFVILTLRLDHGSYITLVQPLNLENPIQKGDRVKLITQGGVTKAVTTDP